MVEIYFGTSLWWGTKQSMNRILSLPSRNSQFVEGGQHLETRAVLRDHCEEGRQKQRQLREPFWSPSPFSCPTSSWTIITMVGSPFRSTISSVGQCWLLKGSFAWFCFALMVDQKLTTLGHLFMGPTWILDNITVLYTSVLQTICDEDRFWLFFFFFLLTSNLSWMDAVTKHSGNGFGKWKENQTYKIQALIFFVMRFNRHKRTLSSCYKCFCVLLWDAMPLSIQTSDKQLKGPSVILRAYNGQHYYSAR